MRTCLLVLGLLALSSSASLGAQTPWYGPQQGRWGDPRGSGYPQARLWVEDEREYFRRGDRLGIRFSTSDDAYVALIHVDSDGNLDFLFPLTPWDNDYVRGGRVYSLPRGYQSGWAVRGRPGIGYLYLIASPVPLDFRYFTGRRGGPWDWSYAGRVVRGDPFWAMEQITRLLVPDWPYAPYSVDYYSYYVEGRHRYPSYACSDLYGRADRGWGWNPYYGGCDRLDLFLREHPYYYDARLYRGDRRAYFRDRYERDEPRHGYKEPVDRRPAQGWDSSPRRDAVPRATTPQRREPLPRDDAPERRPALERRGGERRGEGATGVPSSPSPAPRASERPGDRAAPAGRVAPRARPPVRRDAPRDTLQFQR